MSSLALRPSLTLLPSPSQTSCGRAYRPILPPPIGRNTSPGSAKRGAAAPLSEAGGLQTPPADKAMSSTVYHGPVSEPYGSSSCTADPPRSRIPAPDYFRYSQPTQAQPTAYSSHHQSLPHPSYAASHNAPAPAPHTAVVASGLPSFNSSSQPVHTGQPVPEHATRPSTPNTVYSDASTGRRDSTTAMMMHGLQIPKRISPRGGSLSEFAAQTCCFFWFESFEVLVSTEQALENKRPIPPLSKLAVPGSNYKKWVHSIISTTQVSQNVVLLALLFIHRLKHATRTVLPQPGSEYRLLTVALMLGNKFLDDNTYTNKTWAEVSGMTVQEIHVMEVEFLSNMRYNLYATAKAWEKWLDELKVVHEYCERAQPRQPSPISIPSPHRYMRHSPIPSPTGSSCSATSSRQAPFAPNWSFSNGSPLSGRHNLDGSLSRKRSFEGDPTEPPAKRATRPPPQPAAGSATTALYAVHGAHGLSAPATAAGMAGPPPPPPATHHQDALRLPAPSLSLNTQLNPAHISQPPPVTYAAQPMISLPPLTQGARAVSTVYPTTSAGVPPLTSYAPQANGLAASSTAPASRAARPSGYQTPTKRQSPTSTLHPPFASSPLAEGFSSGVHTPISQSPSIYLQQRPSPYRPIRHVNTLLYPPPSASLHEYHLTPSQMHYQPLGRRNDVRTGIVPEYRAVRNTTAASVPISSQPPRGPLLHPSLS